jgi:putative phosphoesterase
MKIALIADIHANLPALTAVLADIDQRPVDAVFCLGDLVGYHVYPNEVIDALRARHIPTIAGNYDFGVGQNSTDCGCAYRTEQDEAWGKESIGYTNSVITPENRAYLRQLACHMRLTFQVADGPLDLLLVHGSPRKINEYLYEDRPEASMIRMLEEAGTDVLCFGHTHIPYHRQLAGVHPSSGLATIKHAINVGSVGKPKDGNPAACYALLSIDSTANKANAVQVEFIRVPYAIEASLAALDASPLPKAYVEQLREAR